MKTNSMLKGYIYIITSVITGALIFNERVTAFTILGTVLVLSACVIIATNDIKSKGK